jgi:H+/Cl- antiporter ClcA
MAATAPPAEPTAEQVAATMGSRRYVALLLIVAVVGVVVSLVTWCFLQLIYEIQQELYTHLPHALGYEHGPPLWWPLPVLGIAGVLVALAITRLPGNGGHIPARGLATGGKPSTPAELPGIVLAGLIGTGFAIVLGPEGPLLALGPGVAMLAVMAVRRDTPPQVLTIVAASGAFAALSFLFASPLIAAIIVIEATGLGGAKLPLVVLPGLLAAGIGSLLEIGMGSWTGLNVSHIRLDPVTLPPFGHPTAAQFGWSIALALAIGIVARLIMQGGLLTHRLAARRELVVLPVLGLIVAGLAIAFHGATDKSVNEVLFDGQAGLPGLITQGPTWALSALALLLVFKGLAYGVSMGGFRGGPTFPAVFLGAAAGIMAARLPGYALTPAVAVGLAAAVAAVLKLPLSAVVLGTLMTAHSGTGQEPLIIVGVAVAYLSAVVVSRALPDPEVATAAPAGESRLPAQHEDPGAAGAAAEGAA